MIVPECPACHGIKGAVEHCDVCGGAGMPYQPHPPDTQKVVKLSSYSQNRAAHAGKRTCLCQRLHLSASDCPICDGDILIATERMQEAYDLIMRHQRELHPLHTDADPPPRMPIAEALRQSPYGAYAEWHLEWRYYVETLPDGLVMVSLQDTWRPIGRAPRSLMYAHVPLAEAPNRWPDMPPLDKPIWQPLPMEAAVPAMKTWKGGRGA